MLALLPDAPAGRRLEILCIGAHCDDVEIGCGGTLLALRQRHAGLRVNWLVLTSNPERLREARRGMAAFVPPAARGELHVHDLPDGHLPAHFSQVKACFEAMRAALRPDWIFSHHGADRHQDHSLVAEVTWQTFRDHLVWEYEIPKFDGDLATPNAYVPLSAEQAERKARHIVRTYRSQHGKSWFAAENLLALMRLRGLECRSPSGYAEGFHCRKLVLGAGTDASHRSGR